MSATLPNRQPRIRRIKIVNRNKKVDSDSEELSELETATDEGEEISEGKEKSSHSTNRKVRKKTMQKKSNENAASPRHDSPMKRKRSPSPLDLFDIPDLSESEMTSASLNESDFADLDDSEDERDIERIDEEALIQEEEDKNLLESKFHVIDDAEPFAYAVEEESDQDSNSEEYWVEAFDALAGSNALFETASLPKFQIAQEDSNEALLEEEFFMNYASSDDEGESIADEEDESPFAQDGDDDRVGWECFFSDGESKTDSEEEDESDASTTDDEPMAVSQTQSQIGNAVPITPAKAPAKTELTSCLKKTHVLNIDSPSKQIASTPIKLNTSHKPPMLGSWARDSRLATGIIDNITVHSPGDLPQSARKPRQPSTLAAQPPVDVVAEAMTSLDDIMYTNDFLMPEPEAPKAPPSRFNKPIHVGAFRKGQARSSMIREDSFKDEWYNMTSRNKERPGRSKAVPVLGVASESLSRKEKRRRRKMRAAAGMSIGGSTFGGSIDEGASDNEYNDGVERAGLGLGPPVESLFLFHTY